MRTLNLAAVLVAAFFAHQAALADAESTSTTADVRERTAKFGRVCLEGDPCASAEQAAPQTAIAPTGTGMSGKAVYDRFCFACHSTGVGGAPILADEAQWAPKIDQGWDVMMTNSKNGINLMPPMGTCLACSDEELEAAINYMIQGSE